MSQQQCTLVVAWAIWGWDAVLVAGIGCFVAVLVVSSVYQGE